MRRNGDKQPLVVLKREAAPPDSQSNDDVYSDLVGFCLGPGRSCQDAGIPQKEA